LKFAGGVLKLKYADGSHQSALNYALSLKYTLSYKYLLDMLVCYHAYNKSSYLTLQTPTFITHVGISCLAITIPASSLLVLRVVFMLFLK
jgi:hypothetical protein